MRRRSLNGERERGGELVRRALLDPLLDALSPASILVCWADDDPESAPQRPEETDRITMQCRVEGLAEALDATAAPDVVWVRGRPNWHSVRAVAVVLDAHSRRAPGSSPVVIVEGAPRTQLPPWSANETYAAELARAESAERGLHLATGDLARSLDPDATVLWCATEGGAAAALTAPTAARLAPWLAGRRALLEVVHAARRDNAQLIARSFELFELLDRAQRTGTAVVRSTRFRVGTRVVRAARRIRRKEEVFRAPREILARQPVVDAWRQRLEEDRDVADLRIPPDALGVTFVLPELRLSGGALVVAELVNELRLLGAKARIATLKARADVYRTRLLHRPLVFDSIDAMTRDLPTTDLVVATHWSTAAWVRDLVAAGRARSAAYLVQDYEAWFYPEDDLATRLASRRRTR